MKVFGCKCDKSYDGGLILVAANNIPDKIYIPRTNMEVENHLEEFWVDHKTFDSDIEYVRKDASIEKAVEYINSLIELLNEYGHQLKKERIIEGFKKYMEE